MASGTSPGRATRLALIFLALLAALEASGRSDDLTGTPAKVFDGDSFVLRTDHGLVEVRLVDIDAPEHGQPYADTARSALDNLIWKERLRAVVVDEDVYHRKVCRVYRMKDGLYVNERLVRDGDVWVYRRRVRDLKLYSLEVEARRANAVSGRCPNAISSRPGSGGGNIPGRAAAIRDQNVDSPVASIRR